LTFLAITALDGLAGLSAGAGVPASFLETVLNSYPVCGSVSPPVLLGPPVLAGDAIQFTVTGGPGLQYVVEASTNLSAWTPLQTNLSPFAITNVLDRPARFFRARFQP
jgi:hypothetical protein